MSSPETPIRSPANSASSSFPTLSPIDERDNLDSSSPALQLTPRSKVRALLAGLDDESDNEITTRSDGLSAAERLRAVAKAQKKENAKAQLPSETITSEFARQRGDDEDDELDIVAPKPRGRMAARMAAQEFPPLTANSERDNELPPLAEKERFIPGNATPTLSSPTNLPTILLSSEEDEGSTKAATVIGVKRRRLRRARSPKQLESSSPDSGANDSTSSTPALPSPLPAASIALVRNEDKTSDGDDEQDLPANPAKNPRLIELVAKKRAERLAAEQVENEARQKRLQEAREAREARETENAQVEAEAEQLNDNDDISDEDIEFSQRANPRPGRQASKKAMIEMARETQRISRNMQLAHEARTRKKITTASFLARFNFRKQDTPITDIKAIDSASSPPASDLELPRSTPPTSPSSPAGLSLKQDNFSKVAVIPEETVIQLSEIQNSENLLEATKVQENPKDTNAHNAPKAAKKPSIRERFSMKRQAENSDSELEILDEPKTKIAKQFARIKAELPEAQTQSLRALRQLANLGSPGKRRSNGRNGVTLASSELSMDLQKRARQQAAAERAEKLQELKNKGYIIQTPEERLKDQEAVEDLVAKARKEADEIMKKEKAAAKKIRKENGGDGLDETSDEDGDYEEGDHELSLEEDENDGDDETEGDEAEGKYSDALDSGMIDAEASESEDDEDDGDGDEDGESTGLEIARSLQEDTFQRDEDLAIDSDGNEDIVIPAPSHRRTKHVRIVSDDEGEDIDEMLAATAPPTTKVLPNDRSISNKTPRTPASAKKAALLGLPVSDDNPIGLTQMFANTMADTQTQDVFESTGIQSSGDEANAADDSLDFLRQLPPPSFPEFTPTMTESHDIVRDSQTPITHGDFSPTVGTLTSECLSLSPSDMRPVAFPFTQLPQSQQIPLGTQFSDAPEPTQDVGFGAFASPINNRFVPDAPPSTVETVLVNQSPIKETTPIVPESPVMKRKGKLVRRAQISAGSESDPEEMPDMVEALQSSTVDAFSALRAASKKRVKKPVEIFDKKKSNAKDMVHEQAEESEDEYAGLGGASDDDMGEDDGADVADLIDEATQNVDENQLAAFYADKARAEDEKKVEKIFKDITSGFLRKKRGAADDFDLSDSDEDEEARRRTKRQEFARMRKALLEDEDVKKIAENPKRAAFLRAIEDRDDDGGFSILDEEIQSSSFAKGLSAVTETQQAEESQGQSQQVEEEAPSEDTNPLKRKLQEIPEPARLPPHLRRTKDGKKASTISEIRESLSNLIEDPNTAFVSNHSDSESSDASNHSDDEEAEQEQDLEAPSQKENRNPFTMMMSSARRAGGSKSNVVDRIQLKRQSSTSSTSSTGSAPAFQTSSTTSSTGVFKMPNLLRRATTNSSLNSTGSSSSKDDLATTERTAGDSKTSNIKRGGSKKSSINYASREMERRAGIVKVEERRVEGLKKIAGLRKGILGALGKGHGFE